MQCYPNLSQHEREILQLLGPQRLVEYIAYEQDQVAAASIYQPMAMAETQQPKATMSEAERTHCDEAPSLSEPEKKSNEKPKNDNLRKAVAEYVEAAAEYDAKKGNKAIYDAKKGNKNAPSQRAIGKKWRISKSTIQRYCADKSKLRALESKSGGSKSLLTDGEFEEVFQFSLDAERSGKWTEAELISKLKKKLKKLRPDLDPKQVDNYCRRTFLKKQKERLNADDK